MAGLVKDNDVAVTRTIVGGEVTKDNDVVVTRTTLGGGVTKGQ